jgi:hypothetical protein
MDPRIFGKELTNLVDSDLNRYKRNYSFLHGDRLRDHSLNPPKGNNTNRLNNRTTNNIKEDKKNLSPTIELTDAQMVPEYFFENMQFLKSKEKETHKLNNYVANHKTVSEQSRAKLIDWLS